LFSFIAILHRSVPVVFAKSIRLINILPLNLLPVMAMVMMAGPASVVVEVAYVNE